MNIDVSNLLDYVEDIYDLMVVLFAPALFQSLTQTLCIYHYHRSTPVAQLAPRNLLTRWDVSSIPANGIFLTKN